MALAARAAVVRHLLQASVLAQLQYRFDFMLELVMACFWVLWNIAPLWVVYSVRPELGAFSFEEATLVMSAFLILKALIEGLISPNLLQVVEHIRKGTLDFVLLKPVDSQLLVSTARFLPSKLVYLFAGLAMLGWALARLEPAPSPARLLTAAALLGSGAVLLYALWLLVICSAFWFVRVDNLSYLFNSLFDAARWPIGVFRGWVKVVLTFVLPIAIMTSYPAKAALGTLDASAGLGAVGFAALAFWGSRRVWRFAVRSYSSASS